MAQKIKNLPKIFRLNKKWSIPTSVFLKQRLRFGVLLFLLTLGLALPLYATAAAIDWKEALIAIFSPPAAIIYHFAGEQLFFSTLGNLALALVTTVLQVFLVATNAFLSMTIGILAIVTHPNFIVLSYTNPAENPLLQIGWTLTRDLTNIGFIIVLVIIGLATALRIREYQWQKTLPLLIGVALLINFTPVILGIVVDASNIIMNFFLKGEMVNLNFVESIWSEQWAIFLNSWQVIGFEIDATSLAKAFSLIVFGGISGLIFSVYSLLFILRYIAIWMLVILSPIAFFCYILPATRGIFSLWWNQFLQWCIIGVAAAFFLYLSSHLIGLSYEGEIMGPDLPDLIQGVEMTVPAAGIINLVNTLLPYGIAIGFLVVGFFVALSTSAMGATAVITAAQKGVKTAGAWTAKKGGKFTGEAIRGFPGVSRAEEGIRRGLERVPGVSRLVGGKGAFDREHGRRMEEARKSVEKIPDNREGNRVLRRIALGRGPITRRDREERASALEILAKRGALDLTDKEAQKLLPEFQRFGGDIKPIRIARPDLVPYFTTIDPATKKPRPMTIESAMNRIKPRDFAQENVQREALENMEVVYHFLLDRAKVKAMAERGSDINKRQIIETIKNKGPAFQVPTQYRTQLNDVLKEMADDPRWPV